MHASIRSLSATRRRRLVQLEPLEGRSLMATLLGITATSSLIRFDSSTPGTTQTTPITGIGAGETIRGSDIRPATGALYALTSDAGNVGRLYTIDTASGAATLASTLAADPADLTNPFTSLAGTSFGVDFNPVPDRLRVVSNTGQDLRINVATGLVTTDADINPPGSAVAGVAYANSFAGATSTTLYDIDPTTDRLSIQNPPNNGTLVDVGALGVDAGPDVAFDILATGDRTAPTSLGFASLNVGGVTGLYSINLATGAATSIGTIGTGTTSIVGLAALPDTTLLPAAGAVGVDGANNLLRFSGQTPGTITSSTPITGLQAGETLLGIDFRPATGGLYALGLTGRVYTIDPATAAVTSTVVLIPDPAQTTGGFTGLSGTSFGVDFNPVPDRLRVVSNTGQNLRINVTTGTATNDGALNPAGADVVAAAYINSFAGATTTTLYVIDAASDTLRIQNPPNNGTLVDVGALGVDASEVLGFDIRAANSTAIASLVVGGTPGLYSINLTTGAASLIGAIGGGTALTGFALVPNGTINFSAPVYTVVEGQLTATITVTRTGGTAGSVSASYATTAGTATPTLDYTNVSGTITFADGDATPQTFTVPILNDANFEYYPNETVNLTLTSPTGGAVLGNQSTSQLQIIDDEPRTVSISDVFVNESAGTATFTLSLDAASGLPINLAVQSFDQTAIAGQDYTAILASFVFNPGVTSIPVTVGILNDARRESTEYFSVVITSASNALIGKAQGIGAIIESNGPLVGQAAIVTGVENTTISRVIAIFIDPNDLTGSPGNYTAVIDWGDGTPTTLGTVSPEGSNSGTITSTGIPLQVTASHVYQSPGTFAITVRVARMSFVPPGSPITSIEETSGTFYSQAVISDGTLTPAPFSPPTNLLPLPTLFEGSAFNFYVGSFSDPGGAEDPGTYIATIDWGDGSAISQGSVSIGRGDMIPITPPPDGMTIQPSSLVDVFGIHTYAESGMYPVRVVLRSQGGSVATIVSTLQIIDRPQFLTGILSPDSDSGASDSDAITSVSRPTFTGFTEPGSIVRYFAELPGGSKVQVGQGAADAAGSYSITTTVPFVDGSYVITADTVDAAGVTRATATIVSPLVIDTVGPQVTDLRFNRLNGVLLLGLRDDRSGLDQSTVVDGANYLLTNRGGSTPQTLVRRIQSSPSGPTGLDLVTLTYNNGARLKRGNFTFIARSGGIADVAGNSLDGEFYGTFPSGNDRRGGDFVANFAAFHRQTNAPQPTGGFATPIAPGTRGQTIVFGNAKAKTGATARKAKAAPIAVRAVKFGRPSVVVHTAKKG